MTVDKNNGLDELPSAADANGERKSAAIDEVQSKKHLAQNWLSGAVTVALLTASAYGIAFAYEWGYAQYFGIPVSLVEVSLGSFLVVAVMAIILYLPVNLLVLLLPTNTTPMRRLLIRIMIAMFLFIMVSAFSAFYWPVMLVTFLGFVVPVIGVELILPFIQARKRKMSFRQAVEVQEKIDVSVKSLMDIIGNLGQGQGSRVLIFFSVILIIGFLAMLVGGAEARHKRVFPVVELSSGMASKAVIVSIQGNRLLCMPLDDEKKELKRELIVINMDEGMVHMKMKKIGPLKLAPEEEPSNQDSPLPENQPESGAVIPSGADAQPQSLSIEEPNVVKASTASWWTAIGTMSLAVVTVFAVFIEKFLRWWRRPRLHLSIRTAPPDCQKINDMLKSASGSIDYIPTYFYRLLIENIGRSTAEQVEVYISNLRIRDKSIGDYTPVKNFMPLNLVWSHRDQQSVKVSVRIPRGISKHCDFFHAREPELREKHARLLERLPERYPHTLICLETSVRPNNLSHILRPSNYKATLKVASANAQLVEKEVEIDLKPRWFDSESVMFSKGCVVKILD